jgi:hypothetical protein
VDLLERTWVVADEPSREAAVGGAPGPGSVVKGTSRAMYDRGGGSVLAGDDSLGAAELNRSGIGRVPTDAHASTP